MAATIAIIDTGFDLDHDFLQPKILKNETDEEPLAQSGWDFHDNSHLKKSVITDSSEVQEVLLYRSLRAKGHKEGLTFSEFQWFKKKSSDKDFMNKVKLFKRHSHGTFVAGIALREGENINIYPIRGLNIPYPVVAVEDNSPQGKEPLREKTPERKFQEEIKNSLNRVSKKFDKICKYVSSKKIEVVNASYGITYKNILTRFRESYKELTGQDIDEPKLQIIVNDYFTELYRRGERTIKRYPNMLFIFSAGNSALDNDLHHHYPSRIKLPNTITVAAMNGDYLASFSNYGVKNVDIGAPGVAILSLVPKVYSADGSDLYSPSSGTSMAAPYISNLAAQILNSNSKLTPVEIKKIILSTGETKDHLKTKLISSSIVNNEKALKVALLTRELSVDEAINLGSSNLIPLEDSISIGQSPAIGAQDLQKKMIDAVPGIVTPQETDDDIDDVPEPTKSESSQLKNLKKEQPDNSDRPLSAEKDVQPKSSDPVPSNQSVEQSQKPSEEPPASSSEPQPLLPEAQSPESVPSSP